MQNPEGMILEVSIYVKNVKFIDEVSHGMNKKHVKKS